MNSIKVLVFEMYEMKSFQNVEMLLIHFREVPIFLTQNTSRLHKLDKVMQIVLKRLCCCYVCIHAKTVELM